jgi:hypothetical protein
MGSDKTILLGLTTTPGSDWRDKIDEIKEMRLTELALFPTFLKPNERQELYRLLEQTPLVSIPYVHLRDDFTADEIDYFINKYQTKVFSCHADPAGYAFLNRVPKYNSLIYIENPRDDKAYAGFNLPILTQHQATGICLDLAHAASTAKTNKKNYSTLIDIINKLPVAINHVGGFKSKTSFNFFHSTDHKHHIDSLNDFDYLKDLPNNFFAKYICLELENSFLEQQEVKQYLELILSEKL